MRTLLVVDASARVTRSITRSLTRRHVEAWRAENPDGRIVHRDVGRQPPRAVDEQWIAAAFVPAAERSDAQRLVLAESETLIAELEAADEVTIGTPIYNFGMPGALKCWVDQIARIGRTFAFDAGAEPRYTPLLRDRPCRVLVAAGDAAMHPGGAMAHLNFLEPHLTTVLGFLGITDVSFERASDAV